MVRKNVVKHLFIGFVVVAALGSVVAAAESKEEVSATTEAKINKILDENFVKKKSNWEVDPVDHGIDALDDVFIASLLYKFRKPPLRRYCVLDAGGEVACSSPDKMVSDQDAKALGMLVKSYVTTKKAMPELETFEKLLRYAYDGLLFVGGKKQSFKGEAASELEKPVVTYGKDGGMSAVMYLLKGYHPYRVYKLEIEIKPSGETSCLPTEVGSVKYK